MLGPRTRSVWGRGVRRCGSLLPLSFRSYVTLAKPPPICELYFTLLQVKMVHRGCWYQTPKRHFCSTNKTSRDMREHAHLGPFSIHSWIKKPCSANTAPKTVAFQSLDPSLPGLSALTPQLPFTLPTAGTWLASLTPALPHQPLPYCHKLSAPPLLLFVQAHISLANYNAAQTYLRHSGIFIDSN